MISRRNFQISIRTLFILTTLVAVFLACFIRIRQRVHEQQAAIARIAELGGKTSFKPTSRVWPWLRKTVGEEYFREVAAVDLDKSLVTDADLKVVGRIRGMKSLILSGFPSDTRLYRRKGPPQNPSLLPSQISSSGIRALGPQPTFEIVKLCNVPVADDGLETISLWTRLQVLDLENTQVTSIGVQHLEKLVRLKLLKLTGTKIDDKAVPAICQMASLQELDLSNTKVSGEGLLQLRTQLPACRLSGSLVDFPNSIDPDAQSMRWKEITRAMWALGRRGELKLLVLAGTSVTDSHLEDLDRLQDVEVIDLRRTKVTAAGIDTLQRALPKCKIVR
jgi:hypothetical protein